MSELLGFLSDELGGADEALALASFAATTTAAGGGVPSTASATSSSTSQLPSHQQRREAHPLLKRSRLYYQRREKPLVGLDNQGATCYLNSLLQSLYLTPDFRQLMYALSDEELGLAHYIAMEKAEQDAKAAFDKLSDHEKAAAREAEKLKAIEPSESAIEELTAMGMDRVHVIRTLKKFPKSNQKEAALDYLFTHDFASDPPEESTVAKPPAVRLYKRIPIEFRRLFAHLQIGSQAVIGTEGITKSFGWDAKEGQVSVQHDIQELYIRLIEALQGSLKGTSGEQQINSLYSGTILTRTTCVECGNASTRRENVFNFHAHVKGMKNLVSSLHAMVRPEKLDGNNKYHCSLCQKKTVAFRQDTLEKIPPLMTIALNRHEYNKKTWQREKVTDRLPFPLRIDMQPFQDTVAAKTKSQLEEDEALQLSKAEARRKMTAEGDKDSAAVLADDPDLARAIQASLATAAAPSSSSSDGTNRQNLDMAEKDLAAAEHATDALAQFEAQQQQQQSKGGKKNKNNQNQNQNKKQKGASEGGEQQDFSVPAVFEPSIWSDAPNIDAAAAAAASSSSSSSSSNPLLYDLFSVVVHSGGAHGGHYFAYICDIVGQNNYFKAHPEAKAQYESFLRDPQGGSKEYSCDNPSTKGAKKQQHPTFWYECNDSSISPIGFDKIASQYGGKKTCAYLLLYRSVNSNETACSQGTGPQVPQALQQQLNDFNQHLEEERTVYEKITNEIEVVLCLPSEFDLLDGQLVPAGYDRAAFERDEAIENARLQESVWDEPSQADIMMEAFGSTSIFGEENEEEKRHSAQKRADKAQADTEKKAENPLSAPVAPAPSSSTVAPSPSRRMSLIVDQRITVPELHSKIVERLSEKASEDPSFTPESVGFEWTVDAKQSSSAMTMNQLTLKFRPPHSVEGSLSLEDPLEAAARKKKETSKTLEQLGFSACQHLLLWNGRTINDKEFVTGSKKEQILHVRCVVFGREAIIEAAQNDGTSSSVSSPSSTSSDRSEFYLTLSPTTTLSQFAQMLSDRTAIPTDALLLHTMNPNSKTIKELDVLSESEGPKPIKALSIINQMSVGIEKRNPSDPSISEAKSYFLRLQQNVKLVCVHSLSGTSSEFELEVPKTTTVAAFKAMVFQKLQPVAHSQLTLNSFRMRKMIGLNKLGGLVPEDRAATLTIASAELSDDDTRLLLEPEAYPSETQLDLLVTMLSNIEVESTSASSEVPSEKKMAMAKLIDRVPMIAEKKWTIQQLKQEILNRFGLSHRKQSSFALYRGHATCDEHEKPLRNEFMTLEQMRLPQSQWVWLEEGEIPIIGKINLEIAMVLPISTPSHDASDSSSSSSTSAPPSDASQPVWTDSNMLLADWHMLQHPLPPYVAAPLAPVVTSSAPTKATTNHTDSDDDDDQWMVKTMIVAPPPTYLLTTLFTLPFSSFDTLLELKQVLHCYADSPFVSAPSPQHLRIRQLTRAEALNKLLSADDKPLKKLQINSDKKLAVQITSEPDDLHSGGHALLLKYCMAVPARACGVNVGPAVLQELVFDDGEYPLHKNLSQALAMKSGVPLEQMALLKWVGIAAATKDEAQKDKNAAGNKEEEPSILTPVTAKSGWIVLFPDGPDLNTTKSNGNASGGDASSKPANGSNNNQPQKKQNNQTQQNQKGSKQQPQQQSKQQQNANPKQKQQGSVGKNMSDSEKQPPPAWCLKFGAQGLHEDDIVMIANISDFGCATLRDFSNLVHSQWLLNASKPVVPPGYNLVEKDRAEEIARKVALERVRTFAPKRQEVELKIEY